LIFKARRTLTNVGEDARIDPAVNAAIPELVDALNQWGVTRVTWFQAFHGYPVVWLVTDTDAAKAVVRNHSCFRSTVQDILVANGVDSALAAETALRGVTVESEETVVRDFDGSWFNAMR
jgi:hypothetical protein